MCISILFPLIFTPALRFWLLSHEERGKGQIGGTQWNQMMDWPGHDKGAEAQLKEQVVYDPTNAPWCNPPTKKTHTFQ